MSNPQTFMNKQQQQQDKLCSCFPIRHLAKILKESSSFMSQILAMSSFGKWLQKQKNNQQTKNNKTNTMSNRITNNNKKTCSCTACGLHMHCIVGPSRTQLSGVDPSRIQRYEISLHSLRCGQKLIFPVASGLYNGYAA